VTAAAIDDKDNAFVAIAKASSLCLNDLPMHPQL